MEIVNLGASFSLQEESIENRYKNFDEKLRTLNKKIKDKKKGILKIQSDEILHKAFRFKKSVTENMSKRSVSQDKDKRVSFNSR